ncbi:hypothetical protein BDV98DRAFT_561344 [Pterulicium gracile]|uniref:Uncharacterized protein n=1 Tax=Pterulicium gracile TaxID=1884261 RepID=A0A5C3QSQ4_9AGAR|nr:hypothetical protein BDV98DRAFT_561344 [Pterula gracilis]
MVTNLNPKRIEFPITGPLLLPPMAAPVTAIVDDQDPRIVWTGTWHPFVDPSFGQYNRSFHSTGKDDTDAGPSRAAFSFNGTSLSVYTAVEMDTDVTVATCQLDSSTPMSAKRVRPMDNVVQFFQPICQFTDLDPSTEHKVVVEYVTGGRLNLDYMTYTPTESSGAVSVFVDDGDEGIVYTTPSGEEWVEDLLQGAVGGSRHSSGEVGAKATFHFNGTNVRVYASHPHDQGLSTSLYSIDSATPRTRYSSPSNFSWHQEVFDSGQLEDTEHTLTIEVEKGPVPLDYILYQSNQVQVAGSSINEQVNPPSSPSSPDMREEGLSSGAIAGIAVGVVVVIAAILAFMIFYIRRRRRNASYPSGEASVVSPAILNQALSTRQPSSRSISTKGQLTGANTTTTRCTDTTSPLTTHPTVSPLTTHPPHHAWADPLPAYSDVFPVGNSYEMRRHDPLATSHQHESPLLHENPPRRPRIDPGAGLLTVRNGEDTVVSSSSEGGCVPGSEGDHRTWTESSYFGGT